VCAAAGARWEEERLLQPPCVVESGASEDFATIKGVRAGSFYFLFYYRSHIILCPCARGISAFD